MSWLERLGRKALMGIEPYRPGKPISDVQRELGLKQVIRLSSNENPWPLPERLSQVISTAAQDVRRYPDPGAYNLRRALAKKWGVSPSEVVVGAGTEGVLFSLFQATLDEGDEVVYCTPTYPLYRLAACAAGARCVEVPLGDALAPGADQLLSVCTPKTKVVVLCNPNNPTGALISRNELLALAGALEGRETLLVVDEAYAEYVVDPRYVSGVELFRQLGNVAILRTFSKIYGLASLRVGYAIVPKLVGESYAKVRRVFDVNRVGQEAAVAALEEEIFVEETRTKTIAERERMATELTTLGVKVIPTHTNFLLVFLADADRVADDLLHDGIIVRPGSDLGMAGALRVSMGLPEENDRFVASLRKQLKRPEKR